MDSFDHNKIINEVASGILKPQGLLRKGKSRTWLDDNGWFTTVVEFQPSGFSKGTYLNVGINFNWYKKEYLSFDYGSRENGSVSADNPALFRERVIELAKHGLNKVIEYRSFRSIEFAKIALLKNNTNNHNDMWRHYHQGMICILSRDLRKAVAYFEEILKIESDIPCVIDLQDDVKTLLGTISNESLALDYITNLIKETRILLRLPEVDKLFQHKY